MLNCADWAATYENLSRSWQIRHLDPACTVWFKGNVQPVIQLQCTTSSMQMLQQVLLPDALQFSAPNLMAVGLQWHQQTCLPPMHCHHAKFPHQKVQRQRYSQEGQRPADHQMQRSETTSQISQKGRYAACYIEAAGLYLQFVIALYIIRRR